MRRIGQLLRGVLPTALTVLGILLAWEAAIPLLRVPEWLIPAPSQILYNIFYHEVFYSDSLITVEEILLGFLLGDLAAVLVAFSVVFSKIVERTLYPVVVFFQNVPKITLAPILILWFGVGIVPKILIVILIAFFPVIINTIYGLRSVDPNLIDLARSVAVPRRLILWKIEVPHALPYMFEGFKIAVTFSVIGAFVAEWVSGSNGLGYVVMVASAELRTGELFAAVTVISVIGVILFYGVSFAGQKLFPWHESAQARGPLA